MRECTCGFVFPKPEISHDETPSEHEILSFPIHFEVTHERYAIHEKKNAPDAPPTFRVDYSVQMEDSEGNLVDTEMISEWVCLEHPPGFARSKAIEWWSKRCPNTNIPNTIDDALEMAGWGWLAKTKSITARREGRWWRIIKHDLFWDVPEEFECVKDVYADEEMPF